MFSGLEQGTFYQVLVVGLVDTSQGIIESPAGEATSTTSMLNFILLYLLLLDYIRNGLCMSNLTAQIYKFQCKNLQNKLLYDTIFFQKKMIFLYQFWCFKLN